MTYVLIADLTEEYVLGLVARNGFTNVSAEYADDLANWNCLYAIRDLDGAVKRYNSLQSLRLDMITAYNIQQNG